MTANLTDITPNALSSRLLTDPPLLLDVRETWEFDLCRIEGSLNIPLQSLPTRFTELNPTAAIVAICHHGMRSHYAAEFLRDRGFSNVLNLSGGVDRWARDVDPSMPQY